jgi:2-oxoglutarate dehydrogenase E2 component (dihydrolipoamide succinyltransferase)
MSVEIVVPQLGESIVEATVGQWLKREGDQVAAGETVVSLETDKVNMEVAAPQAGVLQGIRKREGETVAVGEALATVAEQSATPASGATSSANGRGKARATENGSASTATPASARATANATPSAAVSQPAPTQATHETPQATPLARRIASEHGLDLSQAHGTGPGGRVTQDDVARMLETQAAPAARPATTPQGTAASQPAAPALVAPATAPSSVAALFGVNDGRGEERVRMSRRRLTIARRLVEAQQTAAMLTTFNEVDMSAVMDLRSRRRDAFKERHGVSLGFMSFFTRAVIGALKAYPRLNAEIQGDEMVLKRYYDIGIAVSASEGLVVPVLRDADRLTFAQIEQQIAALAGKARKNELSLADLQGGTFTITNGGTFGSLLSTPILNFPQVGILGMHKIEERPIAKNGQVVIHPMMYLAVSYDHRIVDGAEAVGFLVRVKELLEDPETLLLEG